MKYFVVDAYLSKGFYFDTCEEANDFIQVEKCQGRLWHLIEAESYYNYTEKQNFINEFFKKIIKERE